MLVIYTGVEAAIPLLARLVAKLAGVGIKEKANCLQNKRLLLGLEYKSRVFSRKLHPGELLHGHNSVNSQQILMGLQETHPISLDRVYPKYQND